MKKRIAILAALAVLLTSSVSLAATSVSQAGATLALEKMESTSATVTASRLNVREGPSTSFHSICLLVKGQEVTVIGKLGDWYAVYSAGQGIVGAVDGRYLSLQEQPAVTASKTVTTETATVTAASKTKDNTKTKEKVTPSKGSTPSAITASLSQDEQKLLELVNKARTDAGLDELKAEDGLMKVARMKAKDMAQNSYFSHQSPTYGSPFDMMRQFDNTFKSAGENIAGNKTVEGAFKAWMSSDSHKKNILNVGFQVTGIGIEESGIYGKVLVQQFIGR